MRLAPLAALTLALAAAPLRAFAADPEDADIVPLRQPIPTRASAPAPADDGIPPFLRWMLAPLKRGMFVRLPVIDTDPNRGITGGIMPIVVLQGKNDERIEQIHAPSLTYNRNFGFAPTYRYYYYPQEDASLVVRASRARYEHEAMAQYEDHSFLGTPYDVFGRVQQAADSGQRFFGSGPDSPKARETNFKEDFWQFKWGAGTPLWTDAPLRAHLTQRYQSSRILNGPLPDLPTFRAVFPRDYSELSQQTFETRVSLDYDTRDHGVTTGRGSYGNVFFEQAVRGFVSQYDYKRLGLDARWFKPWPSRDGWVFAAQGYYEQLLGPTPPFWLLPALGGKYSLRAYGDGRYVDRGVAYVNAEQRIKVYEAKTAGVTTELQVAPFVGAGEVFDHLGVAAGRTLRPVVGTAFRAVAKPQVVGSVDVGVGREGVSVFTDINYSF